MKVKFFLFAASIAALSLAGCAKDENEMQGNPDNPIVAEGAGTMNISLKYAVGTRANGDYEDGTESESKVRDLTVYFFDKDEKYLGKGEAPKLTELPGDGHNIEKRYRGRSSRRGRVVFLRQRGPHDRSVCCGCAQQR